MSVQSLLVLLFILLTDYIPSIHKNKFVHEIFIFMIRFVLCIPFIFSATILLYGILLLVLSCISLVFQCKTKTLQSVIKKSIFMIIILLFMNMSWFSNNISLLSKDIIQVIQSSNVLLLHLTIKIISNICIVSIGYIFVVIESNAIIITILKYYSVSPNNIEQEKNIKELGRGKLIGFLERTILYFLILTGNFASIGFVIAAKALARYKEFENRDFAEYFLIGTLASVSLTLIISYCVKTILENFVM